MSRVENVVFVGSNFRRSREDVYDALDDHEQVYIKGQSQNIEVAINLAEFFVKSQSLASYTKFTSSIGQNEKRQTVSKCTIALEKKVPKKKEPEPVISSKPKYAEKKDENKDKRVEKRGDQKDNKRDDNRDRYYDQRDDRKDDRKDSRRQAPKQSKGDGQRDNRQRKVYRDRHPQSDWSEEYDRQRR